MPLIVRSTLRITKQTADLAIRGLQPVRARNIVHLFETQFPFTRKVILDGGNPCRNGTEGRLHLLTGDPIVQRLVLRYRSSLTPAGADFRAYQIG